MGMDSDPLFCRGTSITLIVTALSVVMYMQLGLTDAEVGLYTGWLALPGSSSPCGVRS